MGTMGPMGRELVELVSSLRVCGRIGPRSQLVRGIAYDSRKVGPGYLFFACEGAHTDGHRYIGGAIDRGACAIIHSRPVESVSPGVTYLRVARPRRALAPVSAAFFGHPSREIEVVGVTGTNGKSTTAFFVFQLLRALGRRSGLLTTTHLASGVDLRKNPFRSSTPEAVEVQSLLREIADAGCEFAVVEATSHGLSNKNNRLGSIAFDAAVFTNLTHEHLDFHGSMHRYRDAKANLFRMLDRNDRSAAFGVVNLASPHASYFVEATAKPVYGFFVEETPAPRRRAEPMDLFACGLVASEGGVSFTLAGDPGDVSGSFRIATSIRHPGTFNVENAVGAALTVWKLTGASIESIAAHLPDLSGVPGRSESIETGQPFRVVVDFAHSPDAFQRVLPLFRETTRGKLIVLFGSAGERDYEKRALQGRIADRYADLIILTDEDPRGENPHAILEDIASGCPSRRSGEDICLIPDRRSAMEKALRTAGPQDTVLLLGKGHESTIEYRDRTIPWDEADTARSLLAEMGYG